MLSHVVAGLTVLLSGTLHFRPCRGTWRIRPGGPPRQPKCPTAAPLFPFSSGTWYRRRYGGNKSRPFAGHSPTALPAGNRQASLASLGSLDSRLLSRCHLHSPSRLHFLLVIADAMLHSTIGAIPTSTHASPVLQKSLITASSVTRTRVCTCLLSSPVQRRLAPATLICDKLQHAASSRLRRRRRRQWQWPDLAEP